MENTNKIWWLGLVSNDGSSTKCVKKFVKAISGQTVGDIVQKNIANNSLIINSLFATKSFNDESDSILCDPSMPVDILVEGQLKYIHVKFKTITALSEPVHAKSAFDVLMSMRRKYSYLPPAREQKNERDHMYNDILDTLERENVKFQNHQMDVGSRFVEDLCGVLWYIDPFHERFSQRSIHIPPPFDTFTGYRNWKKQHQREPQITSEELNYHMEKLSDLLMLPWFLNDKFSRFRSNLSLLLEGLHKYHSFLDKQKERSKSNSACQTPIRSWNDNFAFYINENGLKSSRKNEYSNVTIALERLDFYEPLNLSEFEPEDRLKRRVWLDKLELPLPYGIFTYSHGNCLGNLTVIWKVPSDIKDRDSSEDIRVINDIKSDIPKYATRAMRRDFMDKYSSTTKDKPAILRSMFSFLTGYTVASANEQEATVDQRVYKFLLNSDDPMLLLDLRKNNGRVKDPKFDPFWDELEKYLNEKSVVHERRHTEVAYMPFAISVSDLREQILGRLSPGAVAPSESWIRLNFCPSNEYVESAARYTGRFRVRHAVQQRLLRAQHVDSEYAYFQFVLLKHFAVKWRRNSLMQCLDDKAIIPVGEPGKPTAACSRSHNAGLVFGSGPQLLSLDHDYNVCGIIPSVCLDVDIPSNVSETFHRGNVHITLKDKVFQASSPLRHSTETVKIVRDHHSQDGVHCDQAILVRYTDGGPDHRTTYTSVQFAAIIEFIALDLDMFIACRTAPNQSYNNPAERVMSLLNLGLQNVSLSRAEMDAGQEMLMKSMTSLKKIRNCGKPTLQNALKESVNVPMSLVKEIFARLKRKHGSVFVHDACDDGEMTDILDMLKIANGGEEVDLKKKFNQSQQLDDFTSRHCRQRHYVFQIKKCDLDDVESCPYCTMSPPRIPEHKYKDLHYLPDPVLDQDGQYKCFSDVYGTETNDKDRPSLKVKPEATDRDKRFKSVLVAGKVRSLALCVECGKRRVVFSGSRLTRQEEQAVMRIQEELMYVCGNTLFLSGGLRDRVIVREGINCSCPIETAYYSGITQTFDAVCYHCGDIEVIVNDEVRQLRDSFSIVRPICLSCVNSGLKPSTRNAKKTNKTKKQKQ